MLGIPPVTTFLFFFFSKKIERTVCIITKFNSKRIVLRKLSHWHIILNMKKFKVNVLVLKISNYDFADFRFGNSVKYNLFMKM